MPQATGLAAQIKQEFSVEPRLIKGDNGIFDVKLDGKMIFSKHKAGRFPESEEVLAQLREG
ncbi:MAG: Rdx family protein [Deltaproteobacteria bacterium]|nr:Rdx family protein [Deltaproteobacteria bacterium]TDI95307.1 MAG: SelT/SelW/SelH family protein [Deltaproteobacteria bacterium]